MSSHQICLFSTCMVIISEQESAEESFGTNGGFPLSKVQKYLEISTRKWNAYSIPRIQHSKVNRIYQFQRKKKSESWANSRFCGDRRTDVFGQQSWIGSRVVRPSYRCLVKRFLSDCSTHPQLIFSSNLTSTHVWHNNTSHKFSRKGKSFFLLLRP